MNRVIDDTNVSRMRQGNHKHEHIIIQGGVGGELKSFEFLQKDSEGERGLKIE